MPAARPALPVSFPCARVCLTRACSWACCAAPATREYAHRHAEKRRCGQKLLHRPNCGDVVLHHWYAVAPSTSLAAPTTAAWLLLYRIASHARWCSGHVDLKHEHLYKRRGRRQLYVSSKLAVAALFLMAALCCQSTITAFFCNTSRGRSGISRRWCSHSRWVSSVELLVCRMWRCLLRPGRSLCVRSRPITAIAFSVRCGPTSTTCMKVAGTI
jgi:hypothetical protein